VNAIRSLPLPRRRSISSPNLLLLVVCLAQFMVILDVSIVNVALPSMRVGLHFSQTGLQWVVNAYTLTFAGFLMLGGRAADLLGRRRVFLAGTALFALTSLACAIASSRGLLIAARGLQGLGGAVISPASLSIITSSLPEGAQRNRGLGAWAAMGGLGAASGALLGGLLTQVFGWPAIFLINVPVGAAVVILGARILVEGRREDIDRHFDVAGALLVTVGLVGVTFGIVRSEAFGLGSAQVLVPFAAGAVLLALFVLVEARFARVPLVPISIFRLRALRAANLIVVLMYAALFSMWFFLTLYLQQVLHYDALGAGVAFLPLTLGVVAGSTLAPRMIARSSVRVVLTGGMLSASTGLVLLTGVRPRGSYLLEVLPGGLFATVGMGTSLVAATIAAVQGVPGTQSGLASGLLNTSRLMGGALGLAILGTIADSYSRHELRAAVPTLTALSDGYQLAFGVGALFCLMGAAAAFSLLRKRRTVPDAIVDSGSEDVEAIEAIEAVEPVEALAA
jgi:EmrB/QacA subfamily drug resistance transporter